MKNIRNSLLITKFILGLIVLGVTVLLANDVTIMYLRTGNDALDADHLSFLGKYANKKTEDDPFRDHYNVIPVDSLAQINNMAKSQKSAGNDVYVVAECPSGNGLIQSKGDGYFDATTTIDVNKNITDTYYCGKDGGGSIYSDQILNKIAKKHLEKRCEL